MARLSEWFLPEGTSGIVGNSLAGGRSHVGGSGKLGFDTVATAVHGGVLVETSVVGGERHRVAGERCQ